MRTATKCAARAAIVLVGLLALEGASSVGVFLYDAAFRSREPFAERKHTRYDAELGWAAIEGERYADLYGAGRSLTTDARGARVVPDAGAAPPRPVRVVCIGDSFTLGYGVDDEQTWAHRITELDARVETVNLGQGGYGVDQAYLWCRRAAADLELDLLLLAFIPEDFERMRQSSFAVYGKPWLELVDDRLVVRNTPVPRAGYGLPWLAHNRALLRRLGMVELATRLRGDDGVGRRRARRAAVIDERAAPAVFEALCGELAAWAATRGGELVLVHLPAPLDPGRPQRLAPLQPWARAACERVARGGVRFTDLAPRFDALGREERAAAFLAADEVDYASAAGHYSARGNDFVARALLDELGAAIDAAARR